LGPDVTPPAPVLRTHVVREGESAWTIAATYRLTLDQLLEINHLERPVILHPGDELIVQMPLAEATPTPTPEASS
ncbi:MAG: LysM peptidoglycan-binding domain-containing protein, partial [Anaerolineae bacterium]|nr:LysM peptidoglycan-binding domain-containing protein [Anaerolineae bacterium]